jgi:glycosyltransferase domain-containing protein
VQEQPKVSVVIPTYERGKFALRQIEYWANYPVELIMVDGSARPSIGNLDSSKHPKLKYFHFPRTFVEQLRLGFTEATRPYVIMCDDDEFLVYPTLDEASAILESKPDVAGVVGASLGFSCFRNTMVAKPCYEPNLTLNISADSPARRLEQLLSAKGSTIFYALVRREAGRVAGSFISERTYSCPYLPEYQIAATWCAAGKVEVIRRVLQMRNLRNPPVQRKGFDRSMLLHEWSADARNEGDRDFLISSTDRNLALMKCHGDQISGRDFLAKHEAASKSFVEANKINSSSVSSQVKRLLPECARNLLRQIRQAVRLSPPDNFLPIEQLFTKLQLEGIRYDAPELLQIKGVIECTECNDR